MKVGRFRILREWNSCDIEHRLLPMVLAIDERKQPRPNP